MTTDLTQFAASGGGASLNTQVFTSSGTWTRPSGVDVVWISGSGGGHGGTGASSRMQGYQSAYKQAGNGGGAGSYMTDLELYVTGNLTIAIGAGGGSNADGGTTTVTHGGDTVMRIYGATSGATGGSGHGPTGHAGGNGGVGHRYNYSYSNTNGQAGTTIHRAGGNASNNSSGGGGANPYGKGGNGGTGNGTGSAGQQGGGGGAGGRINSIGSGYQTLSYNGGAGGSGIVIVKWIA